ncbi:hypothetical protein [Mesoplasma melaleucae]|uniref:PD-(D/E)XK endonuclease-like domain-containing protein n=1 Tax=Mesoplasma melaleucae TaxID=81459 RepID=A0A2K8NX81_9MOLU|nr:hypothetical protein [Mesoplasma melaleucae]ATZ17798.1 hypothetical protein EMELA_v1c02250 [Mesoplasma melaleucae]
MFHKNIKVDELTHKYYIDLPSVSALLKLLPQYKNDYKDCSVEFLKPYQERGNCFHKRVEFYINNNFDLNCNCEYSKELHNNLFNNFLFWYDDYFLNINKPQTEISLINNYFLGTFDFMYLDNDNNYHLLDWKTNKITNQIKTLTQLKLYEILIKDNLNINKNTKFIFECFNPNENRFITFTNKQEKQANKNVKYILNILKGEITNE